MTLRFISKYLVVVCFYINQSFAFQYYLTGKVFKILLVMNDLLCNKFIFNMNYKLCNDVNRIMLVSNQGADRNINLFIHPMHAILLSLFNGEKRLNENIEIASEIFSISQNEAEEIILPFLDNPKGCIIKYDGTSFYFPPHILVKATENEIRDDLDTKSYLISPPYDFKTARANLPRRILFVINLTCATDCFYCYADKRHQYVPMSTTRICEIIEEAKKIGVVSFELSGGEVLLHPDWDIILKKFVECGYKPDISTKVPVKEDIIVRLKDIGINYIQISLDTLDKNLLAKNLNVNQAYAKKICETIATFDKYGFNIVLKSTLTKNTCNCDNVHQLLEFASQFKNIKRYTCSSVGYSQYKGVKAFKEMIPSIQAVKQVETYLRDASLKYSFDILDDLSATTAESMNNYKKFKNRNICSGNVTSLTILPDGRVTICEELYWNENFIIGDLTKSSIIDVWNSNKSKSISCLKQKDIPKNSPCSSCTDFEGCRYDRGVCWKEVVAVYGTANWLFPDPTCPFAPQLINDVFYDKI